MLQELNAFDIVQILDRPYHGVDDKGQWVQFLMQALKSKNVLIIGRVENKKLQNYAVVVHRKNIVSLKYLSDDVMGDSEYKEKIFKWAEQFGNDNVKHMTTGDR